jgi:hypothetical protein
MSDINIYFKDIDPELLPSNYPSLDHPDNIIVEQELLKTVSKKYKDRYWICTTHYISAVLSCTIYSSDFTVLCSKDYLESLQRVEHIFVRNPTSLSAYSEVEPFDFNSSEFVEESVTYKTLPNFTDCPPPTPTQTSSSSNSTHH